MANELSPPEGIQPLSTLVAWRNSLAITSLASLLGGLGCFVLFSLHAGLYVLGKRSLTPVFITHSIYHVFGEPYLLMMALVATKL